MKTFFALLIALIVCLSAEAFTTSTNSLPAVSSSSSLQMTVLTYNGKKKNFKAGSPLKNAVSQLGLRPRYSCKKYVANYLSILLCDTRMQFFFHAHHFLFTEPKNNRGDCATCQIMLAGRMTKPCVAKVPEEPRLKSLQEKGLEIKG